MAIKKKIKKVIKTKQITKSKQVTNPVIKKLIDEAINTMLNETRPDLPSTIVLQLDSSIISALGKYSIKYYGSRSVEDLVLAIIVKFIREQISFGNVH